MNILFTAGGRRVEIIQIFKKELLQDKIYVADISGTAPALYCGDEALVIPKFSHPQSLDVILDVCRKKHINVIIPLTDYEIDFYTQKEEIFTKNGVRVLLSGPCIVEIARDKWKTYLFFKENGIPVLDTFLRREDITNFPVAAKPKTGSAGIGVFRIGSASELLNRGDISEGYIYQPLIEAGPMLQEITVDVLTDGSGRCSAISQRQRLKIRAGEVERAVTVFDTGIDQHVRQIVRLLKPFGMINIQLFRCPDGKLAFQEINLRLGGGCPLSYESGVNIPVLIKAIVTGKGKPSDCVLAKEGIYMLRFDSSFYLKKEQMVHG